MNEYEIVFTKKGKLVQIDEKRTENAYVVQKSRRKRKHKFNERKDLRTFFCFACSIERVNVNQKALNRTG